MSTTGAAVLAALALFAVLAVTHVPLGDHMARVYGSERSLRVEQAVYRLVRVDPDAEQRWSVYAVSVLAFSAVCVVFLYGLERLQGVLPWSLGFSGVTPALAWNTAASFVTNTNWQNYAGESTMGHLVQMAGLAVQNFVSAAVGLAVAIALVRGFARPRTDRLGNFWVDVVDPGDGSVPHPGPWMPCTTRPAPATLRPPSRCPPSPTTPASAGRPTGPSPSVPSA